MIGPLRLYKRFVSPALPSACRFHPTCSEYMREAVRFHLDRLNPQWSIVINPRRKALDAPLADLKREVERLFLRCNGS